MPKTASPAAAEGVPTITRRSVLGGLGAITALVAAPKAEAADNADADLLRLEAKFNTAYDRFDAATDRRSEIESRVFDAEPAKPTETPMPKELDDAFVKLTIEQIRDNPPVCQAMSRHREEYRQLIGAWKAECDAIARENGLPEAEAEQNRLMFDAGDAAEAVLEMPAQTLAGIMTKLRVHDRWTFDADEILVSITADIEAMAEVRS